MRASNKPARPERAAAAIASQHRATVMQLWCGALGRTVRCVPTRRTVAAASGLGLLFAKWRRGHARAAAAEWHWLHVLPLLGLAAPVPVAWIASGRRSLLVTEGVRGRPLDAWVEQAAADGWLDQLVDYACRQVAPRIAALHGRGLAYRDLYWNHVFAADPQQDDPPTFLDVERVFRPRWRLRRWIVKDLAGLWASTPVQVPRRAALRFLRAYCAGSLHRRRRWLRAIGHKADRIRRHVPRYG
jgi:hypothetical protein